MHSRERDDWIGGAVVGVILLAIVGIVITLDFTKPPTPVKRESKLHSSAEECGVKVGNSSKGFLEGLRSKWRTSK